MSRGDDGAGRKDARLECGAARDRMLVADTDELAGSGKGALARHVRQCDRCRALAERIVAEQRALDGALAELGQRTLAEGREGVGVAPSPEQPAKEAGIEDATLWRRALPLAAAAVLAAVLLLPPALRRGGPTWPTDSLRDVTESAAGSTTGAEPLSLRVEAPSGGRMAVFETSDPAITVVWFY